MALIHPLVCILYLSILLIIAQDVRAMETLFIWYCLENNELKLAHAQYSSNHGTPPYTIYHWQTALWALL